MPTTRLTKERAALTYRRPVKDKPLRVIFRTQSDGKDRSRAFAWGGPLVDEALHRARINDSVLIVDLDRDKVADVPYNLRWGTIAWREPTAAETERILAYGFTRDPRDG